MTNRAESRHLKRLRSEETDPAPKKRRRQRADDTATKHESVLETRAEQKQERRASKEERTEAKAEGKLESRPGPKKDSMVDRGTETKAASRRHSAQSFSQELALESSTEPMYSVTESAAQSEQDPSLEIRTASEQETEPAPPQEPGQEPRQELRQEPRQEQRQEPRQEVWTEHRAEPRTLMVLEAHSGGDDVVRVVSPVADDAEPPQEPEPEP